ncbi:MAG: zinc ribbon domain-containing protein [Deltaproteobacteria bacterium]|nr:zinc ribbon domain-containing protein [Deltaproteobacteria bacterium]MBW1813039.1 zinc ribbon domain-containing protein [Deltaproteobacteria bacterium]MBW1847507.1 zinc ribbon domain-containing protein [Deltaproteobacteria bacterium]MBW1983507.1 zinc ribbon domain-containing protein [Deltaproteobacteria bacterium]MBW2179690.1 zinc ribbon domain-containing protein [Deltaproteobacteria bacterium]
MPIYEYQCKICGKITSALIFKSHEESQVKCHACKSNDLKRVLSRVVLHQTESQRLSEFDTKTPRDDSFYKDSRNVGLWAKKRAKELGADLGPEFDNVVEKARTGKILDDI